MKQQFEGRVCLYHADKAYGFIRYEAGSIFFHKENMFDRDILFTPGDRVVFEIGADRDGRSQAINVGPVERFSGEVAVFNPPKGYGFINSGGQRIFFHIKAVEADCIGRRILAPGTIVSFEVVVRKGREEAVAVRDETVPEIDLATYTERGQVGDWDGDLGYIRRPSGDRLPFQAFNIQSPGVETIKPETWLQYQIVVRPHRHGFHATNVWVCDYLPGAIEEQFLNAPELPTDAPFVSPAPTPIYTKAERKLSLRELIKRKSAA